MNAEIDLSRPRDLGGLVAATWSMWSRHRSLFFTVALLIAGPVSIISVGVSRTLDTADANDLRPSDVRGLAILAVLIAVELPLLTGGFARAVQRLGDGETVTVGTALRDAFGLFPRVFGALFLTALAIIGGTVLLVVPGIFLLVRLAFAGQAAAIERLGPGGAFGASMRVTKGSWWRVAGIGLLGIIVELVVVTVVSSPFAAIGGAVELAGSALIEAVVTSFVTIFQTLFYFDLRARQPPVDAAATPDAWD